MSATFLIGDVFERMAEIPDGSIDFVMSSPPFLALRSYLPDDHPDKTKEIGAEPDPASFIDTLLALTAEFRRVLAPHGSIAVELGDSYSGSGGAGTDYDDGGMRQGQPRFKGPASKPDQSKWPLPKSMVGIPHLFHLGLAYGKNLLTGEPSPAGQWRVRNVVAWCRPNPAVGALGDKFRPATSYITIACTGPNRYFDLFGVSDRITGAPPLDWWEITARGYSGSHYAVFPEALISAPIEAMTPRKVCLTCGEPSARITSYTTEHAEYRASKNKVGKTESKQKVHSETSGGAGGFSGFSKVEYPPVGPKSYSSGWTDCGHDDWRNGRVLDPFAGSFTVGAVSATRGFDAIGIDLDERNASLAAGRLGLFMGETHQPGDVSWLDTFQLPTSKGK